MIIRLKETLLAAVLVFTLAIFPSIVQSTSPHKRGPHMDYLHIINYGIPSGEFAALQAGSIDITDWPLSSYWINKWVDEDRIPDEITISPCSTIDSFDYDINNQKWPTGSDGVSEREGYNGTFTNVTLGKTWNMAHQRQRTDVLYTPANRTIPYPYDPDATAEDTLNGIASPFGNGSEYDPETSSWKVYFDENCLWDVSAWGMRLSIAYTTDKDYIIGTILGGLGKSMKAWAAAPAQEGFLDVENLTDSSFDYYGPEGKVHIPSLIFDKNLTKAAELLDAAGFKDWDGNGVRNDPRKVAGPDKTYGTGDDDKTSASDLDELIFYIRLDDPNREAAGLKLVADLESLDVPINDLKVDKALCFRNVKISYDYHLYTGGWVLPPTSECLYHMFHSSMYWYGLGWSPNYPGFCHVLSDQYLEWVKNGAEFYGDEGIFPGVHNATFLLNKYVASIPLWSTASAKAYRTGWENVVGLSGEGIDNYWSFFNMRKAGTDAIIWGFKSSPETLNVITAEWKWDRKVLGLIYESLIVRNPYNLAEEKGMLAETWSTGTWGPGSQWRYIDFTLKDNVTWHDGTKLTALDVKWALEFIRDCGPGVAWTHPVENGGTYLETSNLKDLQNVTILTPGEGGSVRVYFNSGSAWALHWTGFQLLPSRKIWMNASAYYGWGYDPTQPPANRWPNASSSLAVRDYLPWEDDVYDPTDSNPGPDGIADLVQDGTGPWKFVGFTGPLSNVETIDLEAWRQHHMTQAAVELYIEGAFNGVGNVNYLGSMYTYPTTDRLISEFDVAAVDKAMFTDAAIDPHGTGTGQYNVDADFNSDNKVNLVDYSICVAHYGMRGDGASAIVPNIAILDMVASQTVVEQGSIMSINVTVENQGYSSATLDVTTYYDDTIIEEQSVSNLAPNANITLTFNWDTTGVSVGDYVISAEASSVPGELYTSDNTYTDGTIYIFTSIVQSSVHVGCTDYLMSIETNVTITDVAANKNNIRFTTAGPTGATGYINTTIPVGLNQTRITVKIDEGPPLDPIVTTNGTHYFVYIEFTLSAHDLIVQYAISDVSVTNVVPSQTAVLQGNIISINATIENQGNYTEAFNVTAYANTTTIATLTNITLTSGNTTTVTFTWNTTDYAKGNYTISANASYVPDEIDIADNTKEADTVVTVLSHDVAIKNFNSSKTVVCQGYNVAINVTVENQGSFTETFNMTVYANTTVIATFTNISLTSENSTTIPFTWNTTGLAKGVYTITINATTLPGEVDIVDNLYVGGTVRVNMIGDVAPVYGLVDIVDVVYVAIHFGAEKGEPNYESNADINGDGIIDIVDIVIIAIHFGETDP